MNPITLLALAAGAYWLMKRKPMNYRLLFAERLRDAATRTAEKYGWPLPTGRDFIITQAAHESNWGRSELTINANNLFGFKTASAWENAKKPFVTMPTREFIGGKWVDVRANFRRYATWEESVLDLARLLTTYPRYSAVVDALKRGDSKAAFQGLQTGGYATDNQYAVKLAKVLGDVQTVIV